MPSNPAMEGLESSLPGQPWAPRALALIEQPVLVVKLEDLSLFWANEAAQRKLTAAAAGRDPQPRHLLPELEAWSGERGTSVLPSGFQLSWQSCLPAGRRETDVDVHVSVTLEVLTGEPQGLALIVLAERETPGKPADSPAANALPPATFDSLTGLPERNYFEQRLRKALTEQTTGGPSVAVAFLDVDHFKQVNDNHGHHVGDEVLKTLAECLRSSLRPGDVVARYGGDEFVVLLHGVRSLKQGRGVARRLSQALAAHHDCLNTTASLGLAVVNVHDADPRDVLQAADEAMYTAKRRGHAGHTEVRPLVPASNGSSA